MANFVLKELPEWMGDGKKHIYPKIQAYSTQEYKKVLEHMHDYAPSFSEGTMRAVIDALAETMISWMPQGHNIKIDGLGMFSLSLGFDKDTPGEQEAAKGDEAKSKYRHVCVKGINFRPDSKFLKKMNAHAEFIKASAEVVTPQKTKLTLQERLDKAKAVIEKSGYMTLGDYATAVGLCRTSASKDLNRFAADPKSGIVVRGSHSHKVWVKAGSVKN